MAGPSVASFLPECRISVSQEEVLANLGGGWERSGHYSLDETPSQKLDLNAEPPVSCEGGDSESESSESADEEANMEFTQESVEWFSPSSSPQAAIGAEGNDGEGNDGAVKEDSYVAAFESDRSQSPSPSQGESEEHPDPQVWTANSGMSAEFLTQPPVEVMHSKFASSQVPEDDILALETIPESDFKVLPEEPLSHPPSPKTGVSENEAPIVTESSIQPFTQPVLEPQPPESFNELQEPASQVQLASERNEIVHDTSLDDERAGADELVNGTPALDNDEGGIGSAEQMPQARGGDELSSDSRLPVDDRTDLRLTEHVQQEHGACHEISMDIPHVETQRGGSGLPDKAQALIQSSRVAEFGTPSDSPEREQTQRGNGEFVPKASKRVNCAEELSDRQKLQRVEASPVRSRSFPKTVMDVVRSRSRSLADTPVDDECNILGIIMRGGVSFPPFAYEKRSV